MLLTPIALRIRAANTSFGDRVYGSAELSVAKSEAELTYPIEPEAFIVQVGEAASENDCTFINQMLEERFAIIIAIDNTVDTLGDNAHNNLDALRRELWKALLGWTPPDMTEPISYAGGSFNDMDRSRLYYQFDFSVKTRIGPEDGYQEEHNDAFEKLYIQYMIDQVNYVALHDFPEKDISKALIVYDGSIWSEGDGWDIANGKASCDGSQIAESDLSQDLKIKPDVVYGVKIKLSSYSSGTVTPHLGTASGVSRSEDGTFEETITAAGDGVLRIRASADFVGSVDEVSVWPMDVVELETE